ncbi:RagB/SusD family nutrient uptake outer membrane protein [Rhodocytophaga rosea]|uniref:RagB/SusD family nutrient uptake outer membrane protein n=1 Tax=Rhodocytophaga rosea TaxID=2704465 RepID=A0A6C0GW43_9BACT|nr:RagB/SusD family nutrient uptake outer membrane protein [Rhodocytophaga rosea]QHT71510.1 RagB/SusD family nutrient uptake outer membrane protein [Rhodocytophaga rosea]
MKKIIVLLVLFYCLNSCNNLDLLPLDRVTSETFYKTAEEFDGAIFGAYSSLQDFWGTSTETLGEMGEYWKVSVVSSDDMVADVDAGTDGISRDIDNLIIRASDKPFAAVYTQIYEGILRANIVLESLEGDNELTADEKARFEGEAKFLRAFFHFEALKLWGTPPLVTKVMKDLGNLAVPNATKEQLFTQILTDLNDAYTKLPASWDDANKGRATKWTARAYEGKVNVWKQDWPAAITAFEDVISNGTYQLINTGNPQKDLEDVFAYNNENNVESIFEVQYGGPFSDDNIWVFDDTHSEAFKASQGVGRSWYWDAGNGAPGGKLGWWAPSQELVGAYAPADARLNVYVYKAGDTYYTTDGFRALPYNPDWSTTGYTVKKYGGQRNVVAENRSPNQQAEFNNERLYRFAELKLLYAEALIAQGRTADAAQQINDIRNRAGLPNLAAGADLTQALRTEKRLELAFEPHRWFDIVRWGIGSQVFGAKWNDRYSVYPLPQTEIDRAGGVLKQNTGY